MDGESARRGPRRDCGSLGLRIAADGTWFYQGSPLGRKELVKLFASVLSRDERGVYWLTTPSEHGTVEVEDAPFVVVSLRVEGDHGQAQVLSLRTNVDDWVEVGADHPLRVEQNAKTGEPAPYVHIRNGMDAKINRPVFYELVDLALTAPQFSSQGLEKDSVGLWSKGQFFPLGSTWQTP